MNIKEMAPKILMFFINIIWILFALMGIGLVQTFGMKFLLPVLSIYLIIWLGFNLPKWYSKKWKINNIVINIIAWSNLAVGIIHCYFSGLAGYFIPALTIGIYANVKEIRGQKKFLILSLIGLTFSIIHTIWFFNIILNLPN